MQTAPDSDILVSLPAAALDGKAALTIQRHGRDCHVSSDPPGTQLGSGGGTVWLLYQTWRHTAPQMPFMEWLVARRRIMIHASGESRRLPGYAVVGKANLPLPLLPGRTGQYPAQVLLDRQIEMAERIMRHAPGTYCLLVACGDVLLDWDNWLPETGSHDVLITGLQTSAEETARHGALICPNDAPARLEYFRQKPPLEELAALDGSHRFALDTGIWLFSARALECILQCCGWDAANSSFQSGAYPQKYDLYSDFGQALGTRPTVKNALINPLNAAVLPLNTARFFHFGTQRSVLASTRRLLSPPDKQLSFDSAALDTQSEPLQINAKVADDCCLNSRFIWIENAVIPAGWKLEGKNAITGIPDNRWKLHVPDGVCIDMVPVSPTEWCLRPYGFDDAFRGSLDNPATRWMGRPIQEWFQTRAIPFEQTGIAPDIDIHDAPLFPVIEPAESTGELLQWMISERPDNAAGKNAGIWQKLPRLSAAELLNKGKADILLQARRNIMQDALAQINTDDWLRILATVDIQQLANDMKRPVSLPQIDGAAGLATIHFKTLQAECDPATADTHAAAATADLALLLTDDMQKNAVAPRRGTIDDQIVWGRSPARLDLAGGWTDTPPWCLANGGSVVNAAVDLNGQPPIQVFGRISNEPCITLRSIDLGLDQRIFTYEELEAAPKLGSGFGLAAAALQLAGFHPRFHQGPCAPKLVDHIRQTLGGGIELSMLAAVPKGSGLGTSSILSSTILAVLSDMFSLKWNNADIFARTMAVEQLLASGGGWQDQAGGMYAGIKLVSTPPGIRQIHELRWLPNDLLGDQHANSDTLLYYTGLTRTAHDILGQIVMGFFRNEAQRSRIMEDIATNAWFTTDALQRNDRPALCEAVRRSWMLNCALDPGTAPAAVQNIAGMLADDAAAFKLLGAGGGGFMLILAHNAECGTRIRQKLEMNPPNPRARFVDMTLSTTGLQVTRS